MPTAGSLRTRHQRGEPKAMNARVSHANTMHPCCCEHTENRATARRPRLLSGPANLRFGEVSPQSIRRPIEPKTPRISHSRIPVGGGPYWGEPMYLATA